MGSCHCGLAATQMGVEIAVVNLKAGNANGISMLPCGGGISSIWRTSILSPKAFR